MPDYDGNLCGTYVRDALGPCVICGRPTCMQLDGKWRHAFAGCISPNGGWAFSLVAKVTSTPVPVQSPNSPLTTLPGASTPAHRIRPVRRGPEQFEESRSAFRRTMIKKRPWSAQDPHLLDDAHRAWLDYTGLYWSKPSADGTAFEQSYPGELGVARFAHMRARAGQRDPFPARGGEHAHLLGRILNPRDAGQRLAHDFTWIRTDGLDIRNHTFVTYDVQAQYLAASRCDIGSGDPVMVKVDSADASEYVYRRPGFVQLGQELMPTSPALYGLSGKVFTPGTWIPTPIYKYLVRDAGIRVRVHQALIWDNKTRLLDQWGTPFRDVLQAFTGSDQPIAILMCTAAKAVYQQFLGGMLRSRRFNKVAYIADAAAMVEATGWANEWRAWQKADLPQRMHLIGGRRDSMWATSEPESYHDAWDVEIPGLPVVKPGDFQPGRLRVERYGPVDDAALDAYSRGLPGKLNIAFKNTYERECA